MDSIFFVMYAGQTSLEMKDLPKLIPFSEHEIRVPRSSYMI